MAQGPLGVSPWEQEVLEHFEEHVSREGELLGAYADLAERSGSESVRYLVGIITDDEARHHQLFTELSNAVVAGVEMRRVDPQVPNLGQHPDRSELAEHTDRLLALEKKDARELKQLRRKLRGVRDNSLWYLLIELMEMDTKKHIHTLQFIRNHLQR